MIQKKIMEVLQSMRSFEAGKLGKTIIIHMKRGDKLLEGIMQAVEEHGIKNAILLSCIGSLQRVHLHRVMDKAEIPKDEFIVVETPCEISAMQGFIVNGKAHFHMVVSDLEQAYTGHLEPDTQVLYLGELCLAELPECQLDRVMVGGLAEIHKLGE